MADPTAPAGRDVVLRAQGVDLVREGKLILAGVSVTIRAGEHWALLGPNGAGKSTLLQIMATYAHPTRGQMDILGRRLLAAGPAADVLTTELVSACFDYPVAIARHAGRWASRAPSGDHLVIIW
jgi:ABC-type molybdenum transport system ATPase subunit/photorepair protein PhrA